MTAIVLKETVQQLPGESLVWPLNLRPQLEVTWKPDKDYANGATVRPPQGHGTGWDYQVTGGAGRTSMNEPRWPVGAGGTQADGSVTWTAVAPSAASIDQLTATTSVTVPANISASVGTVDVNGELPLTIDTTNTPIADYSLYVFVTTASGQKMGCEVTVQVRQ